MNRKDWQDAYGEAPEAFHRRLLEALDGLEEEEMRHIRKRHKLTTALIAAIIAILALAGGALAARELGIFEYFRYDSYKPLPEAEEMVETELGSAENELVKLTVEEAVYDGQGALVQLRFTPKVDAREYALQNPCFEGSWGWGDTDYVVGEEEVDGAVRWHFLGRKDGRREIDCDVNANIIAENGEEIPIESWLGDAMEDGSIVLHGSGRSEIPLGESVTLCVEPKVRLRVKWDEKTPDGKFVDAGRGAYESCAMDAIETPMKLSAAERYIELVPQTKLDRVEVLRAGINLTPVRGYLTLEYVYDPLPEELMGISIGLYDAEGHNLCGSSGGEGSPEIDGKYYWSYEVKPFDELPDVLYLMPDVIDGPPMGRIECRVREVDAPVVTMPPSQGFSAEK